MQHSCLLGQAGADVPPDERRGAAGEVAGGRRTDGGGRDGWGRDGWRTDGWRSDVRFEGGGRGSQGIRREMGVSKVPEPVPEKGRETPTRRADRRLRPALCPSSRTRDFIREGGMERRSPDRHRSPQKQRDGSHLRVSPRGTMTRRQGNADLRHSRAQRGALCPIQPDAGKGTPTSGRHSRAQRGGRDEPQTAGWLPSRRIPRRHGDAQARERRPLASPGGGRHSRAQRGGRDEPQMSVKRQVKRGGRDEPQTAGWLPSPCIPKRHDDAQVSNDR